MEYFLNVVANGLVIGATYALTAMAFALIYKATGVVNFAQGEVMMLTAYVAYSLAGALGWSFGPLMLVAVPAAMLIGLAIERLFIRPMLGEPVFSIVMVTIGLAVIVRGAVAIVWGTQTVDFNAGFGNQVFRFGPVPFYEAQLYALLALALLTLGAWGFFRYSRLGIAMRATANNDTAALLMGIPVARVHALAWSLAAGTSAVVGVLFSAMFSLGPDLWFQGLKAFPAVIVGGLDSVFGAVLGGLIIGLVENFSEAYIGQGLKEIAGFVVIVVVLMVRPYGIFGQREIERV